LRGRKTNTMSVDDLIKQKRLKEVNSLNNFVKQRQIAHRNLAKQLEGVPIPYFPKKVEIAGITLPQKPQLPRLPDAIDPRFNEARIAYAESMKQGKKQLAENEVSAAAIKTAYVKTHQPLFDVITKGAASTTDAVKASLVHLKAKLNTLNATAQAASAAQLALLNQLVTDVGQVAINTNNVAFQNQVSALLTNIDNILAPGGIPDDNITNQKLTAIITAVRGIDTTVGNESADINTMATGVGEVKKAVDETNRILRQQQQILPVPVAVPFTTSSSSSPSKPGFLQRVANTFSSSPASNYGSASNSATLPSSSSSPNFPSFPLPPMSSAPPLTPYFSPAQQPPQTPAPPVPMPVAFSPLQLTPTISGPIPPDKFDLYHDWISFNIHNEPELSKKDIENKKQRTADLERAMQEYYSGSSTGKQEAQDAINHYLLEYPYDTTDHEMELDAQLKNITRRLKDVEQKLTKNPNHHLTQEKNDLERHKQIVEELIKTASTLPTVLAPSGYTPHTPTPTMQSVNIQTTQQNTPDDEVIILAKQIQPKIQAKYPINTRNKSEKTLVTESVKELVTVALDDQSDPVDALSAIATLQRIDKELDKKKSDWSFLKQKGKGLTDYGDGLRVYNPKKETLSTPMYYSGPKDLKQRLQLIVADKQAGNRSTELVNEGMQIIDLLLRKHWMSDSSHKEIYNFLSH